MRQVVDHRGVFSGVRSARVQLGFTAAHGLRLLVAGLRAQAAAAAEVAPLRAGAAVVVWHRTGLIREGVLSIHTV